MPHPPSSPRIVFAGTPVAAVPSLTALLADDADVVGVVTRPDAPRGRRRVPTPSAVADAAADAGLPVIKTHRLDDEATRRIDDLGADLGVIVAYGGLVREPLLSAPRLGWINLHFSLLPAWRGAAPVQRALIAGDRTLGASVFQLTDELDAGDVFAEARYEPDERETAGDVLSALSAIGAELLASTVAEISAGTAEPTPQVGEPSFAPKLALADGMLDFSLPASKVLDRFRGVTPEPGAHTTWNGARMKLHAVRPADDAALEPGHVTPTTGGILVGTATDPLLVERLQPAGKAAMAAADWHRGLREAAVFGS